MEDLDFYRRQVTLSRVDAEVARSQLRSARWQYKLAEGELQAARKENARLQTLTEHMEAQLAELRLRLKEARANFRQVSMEELVQSLIDAIESGASGSENLVIAGAKADIRVALQVDRGVAGVLTGPPGLYPGEALSTISVDIKTSPPTPLEESRRSAVAEVVAAVLDLQAALDRELPPKAVKPAQEVIARAGKFITAPSLAPDAIKIQLASLVNSLKVLAPRFPLIKPFTNALIEVYSAFPSSPASRDLEVLARAIAEVAHSLERR